MTAIEVFGRTIPIYGLMGVAGVCLAMAYALFSCKKFGLDRDDVAYILAFGGIGAVIGAKLLYFVVSAGQICEDVSAGQLSALELAYKYARGGMVFYGGFFGALLMCKYMAGKYGKNAVNFIPVLTPAFALAHGISRLGCLIVGCCYGIRTSGPFAIVYHSSIAAPEGVPLVPVQAMECAGELIIFGILVYMSFRMRRANSSDWMRILYAYVLMYAPLRFCLEFLRGDAERGSLFMFSTSQWISLGLVVIVLVMMFARTGKGYFSSSSDR